MLGPMGILMWLVAGLIAGAIARFLIPGRSDLGCLGTSVLGILGSLVGGTIFNAVAGRGFDPEPAGFIGAVFGAMVLLVLGNVLGGNRRSRSRS